MFLNSFILKNNVSKKSLRWGGEQNKGERDEIFLNSFIIKITSLKGVRRGGGKIERERDYKEAKKKERKKKNNVRR